MVYGLINFWGVLFERVNSFQQGFLVQAQTYVQETDLSKRVKDWETKVVPKLEDEVKFTV
jgi:hypothetical protein